MRVALRTRALLAKRLKSDRRRHRPSDLRPPLTDSTESTEVTEAAECMTHNEISYIIRKSIWEVYNTLGPGLLERVYQCALLQDGIA